VLFEDVEHRLDLGTHTEQLVLPESHDLFLLIVVRRGNDDRPQSLPDDLAHD